MEAILYPITKVLELFLTFFFQLSHDWGAAIILLTLMVRVCLLGFNLKANRQQILMNKLQPQLTELRAQYAQDQKRLVQEMQKLYQDYGVKPFAMFSSMFVQVPIFMGMYHLFSTTGSTMFSVILPWITWLAESDPLHLIPIATAIVTFISSLIPLTNEAILAQPILIQKMSIALIMASLFLFITWKSPVALGLYWVTNTSFAIVERLFFRTKVGQYFLHPKKI